MSRKHVVRNTTTAAGYPVGPRPPLPDPPLSAWALLLSGLSQTAIGAGLLLGHAARVVERHTPSAPPPYTLATQLPLAELEAVDTVTR